MERGSQPSDASEQVSGVEETPVDPMEVFRRQLEDIYNTYGSAGSIVEETISSLEKDEENLEDESVKAGMEMSSSSSVLLEDLGEEASVLLQTLRTLSSPEEKVETLLRKYTELLKEQMNEQVKMKLLQKRQLLLVEQRDRLQLEHSRGILARSRLEKLCRDLHQHNTTLKEDMLQKCKEDEIKRTEIHSHFHNTVVDIQAQIEQHSSRNNKLSQENIELANKLTSIIQQYEKREESWEKIFKQKDLQQQLSDAKLQEANLRLSEEEEKHKREKEYLLKEAIDKTKKCVTLKEQELQMKKQLLTHAAEWKLQVKELKEQNSVMQAQLVLYSQKFEEFQATLAKSNEIYGIFKQEMEKMTTKMEKLEKEANMWRLRFESCNKALTQMIEERSEKGKELELFTVKIDKLETLCRALQEERKVLYDKIKEVRLQTASASAPVMDITEEEIPDLEQLTVKEPLGNPVITADMKKLWKEQERLQKFAASLLDSNAEDKDASDSVEPEPPVPGPVPSKPPTVRFQLDSENHAGKEAIKELQQSESNQQEEEPPIVEPPKEEAPKEEPPKKKPTKEESPEEEPPKEEPPKAESPKEEPPKAESLKEEPPKEEPTKVEPPKEEPPKEEPTKAESPKGEPPKAESLKEEPPNVEPLKEEPPKLEPPEEEPLKDQLPKVPNRNVAEVKPIQQNKHTQKSNSVEHKEPEPEVETHTAPAEASEAHTQQEPKLAPGAEVEPQNPEAQSPEAQEPKPSAHKAQGKKQNSSKRRGAAKGVKKS